MEVKFIYGKKYVTADKVIWYKGYHQTLAKVGTKLIPIRHTDNGWIWTGVLPSYYDWLLMHI